MTTAKLMGLALLGSASLITTAVYAEHVRDGGKILTATLTGAAERPGPGDSDGSGSITITINPGQKRICYDLTVASIVARTSRSSLPRPAARRQLGMHQCDLAAGGAADRQASGLLLQRAQCGIPGGSYPRPAFKGSTLGPLSPALGPC